MNDQLQILNHHPYTINPKPSALKLPPGSGHAMRVVESFGTGLKGVFVLGVAGFCCDDANFALWVSYRESSLLTTYWSESTQSSR